MPVQLPDQGLSLFTIPKNGGTNLWMWSLLMRTGTPCEGNIYDHGWMCDGEVEPETMMIRRDPVDRFISGYRNFRDKRGWWMGFAEFVERMPELIVTNGDLRHHLAPQSDYFPWMPLEKVDHIFDFEDFPRVKEFLEERWRRELPAYHAQKSRFDDFGVTDRRVELIQSYNVNDYIAGFGDVVDDEVVV